MPARSRGWIWPLERQRGDAGVRASFAPAMLYRRGDVTVIGHAGRAELRDVKEIGASTPRLARGQMTRRNGEKAVRAVLERADGAIGSPDSVRWKR